MMRKAQMLDNDFHFKWVRHGSSIDFRKFRNGLQIVISSKNQLFLKFHLQSNYPRLLTLSPP